jgi:hypothetical protein
MNKRYYIIILLFLFILLNDNQNYNNSSSYSQFIKYENLNPVENNKLVLKHNKILYVSRHEGTFANFCYIAKYLGFNATSLIPKYSYGGRPNCYDKDKCRSFVKAKCSEFDYIIISDIISDSYIFLINKCNKKIILEITNRFDTLIKTKTKTNYYKIFSRAIKKKNIIVIENNPFEVYHACMKNIFIQNYYLIRPIGYPPNNILKREHKEYHDIVAIILNHIQDKKKLQIELKKLNIPFKCLPRRYGGPLILSTYKAIIFLPYQVSIMKMMENFRYGVPMIIPSEKLLRNLIKSKYSFCSREVFKIPNGVREYVEFYNDEFRDLFIYFDNFTEIPDIIQKTDFKTLREKEKEFMRNYEKKAIKMWEEVLDIQTKKESIISDKKPLCNNKKFY